MGHDCEKTCQIVWTTLICIFKCELRQFLVLFYTQQNRDICLLWYKKETTSIIQIKT